MLKLLTPSEIAATKASELARDIRRTNDIKEALDKARVELNNVNSEFELSLARQRVAWITEEENYLNKIKDLQVEIKSLEDSRKQLLIPIDIERKRVDNINIEAQALMAQAIEKQKYADDLSEKLQDHLDEVGEKEEALKQREEFLLSKEQVFEERSASLQKTSEEVSKQMQTFLSEMNVKEKDFNTKKRELDLKEINITSRESVLNERELYLNNREREINDKYQTLLRTTNRQQNGK